MTYNVFSGTLNPTQSINIHKDRVWVGFFWYRLTRVCLDKGPLKGCCCSCSSLLCFAYYRFSEANTFDRAYVTYYSYYDNMHCIMIPAMPCSLFNPSTLVILAGCDSVGWRGRRLHDQKPVGQRLPRVLASKSSTSFYTCSPWSKT